MEVEAPSLIKQCSHWKVGIFLVRLVWREQLIGDGWLQLGRLLQHILLAPSCRFWNAPSQHYHRSSWFKKSFFLAFFSLFLGSELWLTPSLAVLCIWPIEAVIYSNPETVRTGSVSTAAGHSPRNSSCFIVWIFTECSIYLYLWHIRKASRQDRWNCLVVKLCLGAIASILSLYIEFIIAGDALTFGEIVHMRRS